MTEVEELVISVLPKIARIGRSGSAARINHKYFPFPNEFGVFWKRWPEILAGWNKSELEFLIRGFVIMEKEFPEYGFGSIPPTSQIFHFYSGFADSDERELLQDWILSNTINSYLPFGTNNYGAKSMLELNERLAQKRERKLINKIRDDAREQEAYIRRSADATQKLIKALHRRDEKVVIALMAKGADPEFAGPDGKSARDLAKELGLSHLLG